MRYFGHGDVRHGQKYQAIINNVLVFFCLPPRADAAHRHPSATTLPRSFLFSILSSSTPAWFWLVVVSLFYSIGHPSQQLFLYIFSPPLPPHLQTRRVGIVLPLSCIPLLYPLLLLIRPFLVGCCVCHRRPSEPGTFDGVFFPHKWPW